jgi:phenylalanyl-tRNA synthetase alpha chain
VHPHTHHGRQVDVLYRGQWLELAECGLIHRDVLRRSGLDPNRWSGLALGMGLERALMLRKDIPDIRYLRSTVPGIHADGRPAPVAGSLNAAPDLSGHVRRRRRQKADELLGDQVRAALPDRLDHIESIEVLARTSWDDLPAKARDRLGIEPHQTNALVRLTLRPLERTLTDAEANDLRNQVHLAIHEGPHQELA